MKKYIKYAAKFAALSFGYAIICAAICTAIFWPSFTTISIALVLTFFSAYGMARLCPNE